VNKFFIAVSIDGYIATEDGGVDWLHEVPNPDNDDYGYIEFNENIDALVMGRNTFEKVLTFGEWHHTKKVFVLSSTLSEVPAELEGKVELLSGPLENVLQQIRSQSYEDLYIDGGKLIQSFLSENLIDEFTINRIPIVLGGGIPLFGELNEPLRFAHKHTTVHRDAMVMSSYVRQS
jgi:dihydrofolate reductase